VLHRFALHREKSWYLASLHESWYHCLRVPYPLTAHYDHPLPYLIHKFIPMYLPAALFRFHALVFFLYLAIISIEELFSHCGYRFFPIGWLEGIAARVDEHLDDGGNCNYGLWGFVDLLAGTYKGDGGGDDDNDDHYSDRCAHKSKGQRGGSSTGSKSKKWGSSTPRVSGGTLRNR
jgi:sterol desaturase/sphingolipid hydroxylase (fatty acid hydroxylase superfamily)